MTRVLETLQHLDTRTCHHLLEQIRWGIDAQQFLEPGFLCAGVSRGIVYSLPRFIPDTNVALTWDRPLIGVSTDGSVPAKARWRYSDRRHGVGNGLYSITGASHHQFSLRVEEFTSASALREALSRIGEEGSAARWELTSRYAPILLRLADIASKKVSSEISSGHDSSGVVDDMELEALTFTYMYGDNDSRQPALFTRLVDRACGTLREGVGDRFTYIEKNARSALDSAVRRAIRDPSKGREIRKIHRELGRSSSPERIRACYRERYPQRSLPSFNRLYLALTVGGSMNASAQVFDERTVPTS